ncbi:hypothetical protein OAS89_03875 [Alphaproteobacteria bacterium]|nr:hypothetical protein [Alphaproteobacteria bacterium]
MTREIIDQGGYGGYQAWSENGFEKSGAPAANRQADPASPTTNGRVWCRSRKIGNCDNIINPLQGLSETHVRGTIGQNKCVKTRSQS